MDEDLQAAPNHFQCSICLQGFNKPKIIDCFHTFCEACLKHYISIKGFRYEFPCPLCRKNIQIPANGINGFSTNFYLDEERIEVKPKVPNCKEHNKCIDVYCNDCCLTVCSKCFITNHIGHSGSDLDAMSTESSKELRGLNNNLKDTYIMLKDYWKHLRQTEKENAYNYQVQCDLINQQVKNICHLVKDRGENCKIEMKKICSNEEDKMKVLLKEVDSLLCLSDKLFGKTSEILFRNDTTEILAFLPEFKLKCMEAEVRAYYPVPKQNLPIFKPGKITTEDVNGGFGDVVIETMDASFFGFNLNKDQASVKKVTQINKKYKGKKYAQRSVFSNSLHEMFSEQLNVSKNKAESHISPFNTFMPRPDFLSKENIPNTSTPSFKLNQLTNDSPGKKASKDSLTKNALNYSPIKNNLNFRTLILSERTNSSGDVPACLSSFQEELRDKRDSNINTNHLSEINLSKNDNLQISENQNFEFATKSGFTFNLSCDKNPYAVHEQKSPKIFNKDSEFLIKSTKKACAEVCHYKLTFDLNHILEKGEHSLIAVDSAKFLSGINYLWYVKAVRDHNSNVSFHVNLETLGLYRVSFALELVNNKMDKNSKVKEKNGSLIYGVFGPGYKWKNVIHWDELYNAENGFINSENNFQVKLSVLDVYRLK